MINPSLHILQMRLCTFLVLLLLVEETEEVTKPDKLEILKIRVICSDLYLKFCPDYYMFGSQQGICER